MSPSARAASIPRSPRVQAKQARMREHIFRAAAGAFAQRGYHATTMQDIAGAAGFSAPSLYTYFAGKQEILRALAEATERELGECIDEPTASSFSLEQRFELLLHRLVRFVDEHRDSVTFLFMADEELHGVAGKGGLHAFALLHSHFERWLEANAKKRDLGGRAPTVAAQYLTGIVFAAFFRWFSGQAEDISKLAVEVREAFFHGIAGQVTGR